MPTSSFVGFKAITMEQVIQHHERFDQFGKSGNGLRGKKADRMNERRVSLRNTDTYAAKYVPHGYRTPSPDELNIRRTARDLKIPTEAAIQIAAPAMAALIDGPCWLVPVPASDGSLTANFALARAIAEIVPGARVKCVIGRSHPVDSSANRRLHGLPRLTIPEHAIIRTAGLMHPLPVYFVDNVITTGTTIAACRRALGWGAGLAYADASKPWSPEAAWQVQELHEEQSETASSLNEGSVPLHFLTRTANLPF